MSGGNAIREIAVVCVSWRDEEELIGAVGALAEARGRIPASGPRVTLTVVDNGGNLSAGAVRERWPDAAVFASSG